MTLHREFGPQGDGVQGSIGTTLASTANIFSRYYFKTTHNHIFILTQVFT